MSTDTEAVVIQAADNLASRLPQPATYFPPLGERIDQVMRDRIHELFNTHA